MTTASIRTLDRLRQTLASEGEAIAGFVALLKQEQAALSQGQTEGLPALIERKNELAAELGVLANQRNSELSRHGLANDQAGIAAWRAEHPQDEEVPRLWQDILRQAAEAKDLNRLNGELIALHLDHINRALEALRGGHQSLALYGPDGQTTTHKRGRIYSSV